MKFVKNNISLILMFLQLFIGTTVIYNILSPNTVHAARGGIDYDAGSNSLVIENDVAMGSRDIIRYRTIGYTIKLWNPHNEKSYWIQVSTTPVNTSTDLGFSRVEQYAHGGYEYTKSAMSLDMLRTLYEQRMGADFSWMTSGNDNVWFEYDAIFTTISPGSSTPEAIVDPGGCVQPVSGHSGAYYKTYSGSILNPHGYYPNFVSNQQNWDGRWVMDQSSFDDNGGIRSAASWGGSTPSDLRSSFNQQCRINAEDIAINPNAYAGQIVFNPNEFNWKNTAQTVTVSVQGNKTVRRRGSASRNYTYVTTSHWSHTTSSGNTCRHIEYTTHNSSSSCTYNETWKIEGIHVTGVGYDVNTQQFSYIDQIVSDGGTITINTNIKNLVLTGKITEWIPDSQSWGSTSAPNNGSWSGGSPPVGSTDKPTNDYASNSGSYFMDLVAPLESVDLSSKDWTNQPIHVAFKASDNLSDLITGQSVNIVDSSWYRRNSTVALSSLGIYDDKINWKYDFVFNRDGMYSIVGTLKDNATNTTPVNHGLYKYDNTKPNPMAFTGDNRTYIDDLLTVRCTAKDNLSGVAKIEYALTRNTDVYGDESKTTIDQTTLENSPNDTTFFDVDIEENGTWFIHTWITDRAGNVTYTKSKEYKYFKITPDDLTVKPTSNNDNTLRGTRFDITTIIPYFTEDDTQRSTLRYTMPNWTNDNVDKKVSGSYAITSGKNAIFVIRHFDNGSGDENNIEFWECFVPPYGTPLSKDRDGNVIGNDYTDTIQLTYTRYVWGVKITHPIDKSFSVIPEQIVKTQIIKNEE